MKRQADARPTGRVHFPPFLLTCSLRESPLSTLPSPPVSLLALTLLPSLLGWRVGTVRLLRGTLKSLVSRVLRSPYIRVRTVAVVLHAYTLTVRCYLVMPALLRYQYSRTGPIGPPFTSLICAAPRLCPLP